MKSWSGNRKVGNWLVYDRTLIRCMEVIDNKLATDKQYKVVVSPIADGPDIIRENGEWLIL